MKFAFVTIYVKDMDKSISFYNGLLGLEITMRRLTGDGGEMAMLGGAGSSQVELLYVPQAPAADYSGFSVGIEVADLDEAAAFLAREGYPIQRGPASPAPDVRFAFIQDPNGVEIELIEYSR